MCSLSAYLQQAKPGDSLGLDQDFLLHNPDCLWMVSSQISATEVIGLKHRNFEVSRKSSAPFVASLVQHRPLAIPVFELARFQLVAAKDQLEILFPLVVRAQESTPFLLAAGSRWDGLVKVLLLHPCSLHCLPPHCFPPQVVRLPWSIAQHK